MKLQVMADIIKRVLKNVVETKKELYDVIGKEAVKRITTRTRLGKGVTSWGFNPIPLAPLRPSTKAARVKTATSELTSPSKSNLTMTGHMLDSMIYEAKNNNVKIKFDNTFAEQKRKWAEDGALNRLERKFFNLTASEINGIAKLITNYLTKLIKKII
jgi:hypothetical protein